MTVAPAEGSKAPVQNRLKQHRSMTVALNVPRQGYFSPTQTGLESAHVWRSSAYLLGPMRPNLEGDLCENPAAQKSTVILSKGERERYLAEGYR
jgi:hypothetical protein